MGNNKFSRSLVQIGLVLVLAVLSFSVALGQSGTSTVRGTVQDRQGAVVAGANVTLISAERNFSRTQQTNDTGAFVFVAVPPGTYVLEIEAAGFKKAVFTDIRAQVDTPTDHRVELEPGSIAETVTVTSGSEAPLNTSDASIGNTFESRRITELPLNARNVVGLLSLQPGVTRGGSVNGGRSDQANITLDGVDVNEQQRGIDAVTDEAFASVLRVTPDSVQEFRVITTNPNAEQGRSSGAQVSLVTRSGSNEFHGSLYHYHRNTATTANDFFNNSAGVERPKLLRNIFGGSLGGPLKRDRAFFFYNYEGFREASGTGVLRLVPRATLGQGIIRYRTASGASDPTCPAGTPAGVRCLTPAQVEAGYLAANGVNPGTNPAAIAYLANIAARYPANDTTIGDGLNTGGFRFNSSTPVIADTHIGRLDLNLTDSQSLFVRGNYQDDLIGRPSDFPDLGSPSIWYHPKGIAIGHTWTASNRFVNRFTYGLTRLALSQLGDSDEHQVNFRFVFEPVPTRTLTRLTPTHNFVNDSSWIIGNHSTQFGGNVRLIKNTRVSFASAYDFASTNPSGYNLSGEVLLTSVNNTQIFQDVAAGSRIPLRDSLSAFIGRYSGYTARFNYAQDGSILPTGSPAARTFATEEYEVYWQDSWRLQPNLTVTYGLRWSTSTPVYEVNGFQIVPEQNLGEFFLRRANSAAVGVPLNELITLDLGGKANNRPGFYKQDWNNFAPAFSVAWSPDLGDNWFGRLFGRNGKSVIRGGVRKTFDRIGSQLAVNFDASNLLGFASALSIPVNTYNVTTNLAPLFTGPNPNVRVLPGIAGNFATQLNFPRQQAANQAQRIETSLDASITTPSNYSINVSYGRDLWKGLSFETSYVGRFAKDLLAQRDVMHFNNIRDPQSGQTWYEAIRTLIDHRHAGTPIHLVPNLPFFQNMMPGAGGNFNVQGVVRSLSSTQRIYRIIALPGVGGLNDIDYTFTQLLFDDPPRSSVANMFIHPQYAALNAWGTIAESSYNAAQLSVRQRLRQDLLFDFNYTWAHSLDNASGVQAVGNYSTTAFIFNPLDPKAQYADSDFDVRHIINANWVVGLPFGRGKTFFGDVGGAANTLLGGWQFVGIFRWNSGFPAGRPFSFGRWGTNWNLSPGMVAVRPVETSPTILANGQPNLFSNPQEVFLSYRDPFPGEGGDRNVLRNPGYISLDAGLYKTFNMPWGEDHRLTFRWEVYNVTNTQRFTGVSGAGFGFSADPFLLGGAAPPSFGNFTATQTPLNETRAGRTMQFALRYQF